MLSNSLLDLLNATAALAAPQTDRWSIRSSGHREHLFRLGDADTRCGLDRPVSAGAEQTAKIRPSEPSSVRAGTTNSSINAAKPGTNKRKWTYRNRAPLCSVVGVRRPAGLQDGSLV